MKLLFLIALILLPILTVQEYTVPDLEIDNTPAECSNINQLLAAANADSLRLSNYVSVTLPERIEKLNNVLATVSKTCKIIQSRRPSLIQFTNQMTKKRIVEVNSLRKINNEVRLIALVAIGQKSRDDEDTRLLLSEIKAKLLTLVTADDPSQICDDVTESVNDLLAYLTWLGPAVETEYIDGRLANRINELTAVSQKCKGCTGTGGEAETDDETDAGGETGTGGQKDNDLGFEDGDEVGFKCLGSIVVPEHTWLDSLTYTGGVALAPSTSGPYTGTHFRAEKNDDGTWSFKSLGDYNNPSFQYVDGRTGDGSVGLAPIKWGGYSGTHWDVQRLDDGSYALKCMGTDFNPSHLYLDGRTVDGSVGLAPAYTGGYTGAHWEIKVFK